MEEIELKLDNKKQGGFYINDETGLLGEMVISIADKNLTVYHTEVLPRAEGKGLAKKLLNHMTEYARKNGLKVIALCPYVHLQFRRHPEEYSDIWLK